MDIQLRPKCFPSLSLSCPLFKSEFCRLRHRGERHVEDGLPDGQRRKGNKHSGNKINWRSCDVMKTDMWWNEGRAAALYCGWTPLRGRARRIHSISHRKWGGRGGRCPAPFQQRRKLMTVWMGSFPEIISSVCKVKSAPRGQKAGIGQEQTQAEGIPAGTNKESWCFK